MAPSPKTDAKKKREKAKRLQARMDVASSLARMLDSDLDDVRSYLEDVASPVDHKHATEAAEDALMVASSVVNQINRAVKILHKGGKK